MREGKNHLLKFRRHIRKLRERENYRFCVKYQNLFVWEINSCMLSLSAFLKFSIFHATFMDLHMRKNFMFIHARTIFTLMKIQQDGTSEIILFA